MDELTYKRAARRSAPSESPKTAPFCQSIPNSSRLDAARGGEAGPSPDPAARLGDLEARLRARQPVTPRPQAQIAPAESEADRLSAAVTATTPEGVKAELGRKLDADFSGVRLHTGGAAAARAARMGARAFAAGNDVYFGPGGFDPGVAAHELVHTAQQGAVTGAAVAVSAPAGGVQMSRLGEWLKRRRGAAAPATAGAAPAGAAAVPAGAAPAAVPAAPTTAPAAPAAVPAAGVTGAAAAVPAPAAPALSRTDRFKNMMGRAGRAALYGVRKAWDVTGGRVARWSDEAVEEYTGAQDSGDWNALSKTDKAKWMLRNPVAWMRSQNAGQQGQARSRMREYDEDQQAASRMMAGAAPGKKSSLIRDPSPAPTDTGDQGSTLESDLETASGLGGDALSVMGASGKLRDEARGLTSDSAFTTGAGHAGSTLGAVTSAYGLYKSGKDLRESVQQGNRRGARQAFYSGVANVSSLGGNLSGFGSSTAAGVAGGVFGAVTGTVNTVAGVDRALSGAKQKKISKGVQGEMLQGRSREDLADDELFMHDTAAQSAMAGTENIVRGTGQAIGGVLDVASGVANASGAGAAVGAGLTGASLAVKGTTAALGAVQHKRIRAKVSDQTIGLNDDMINRVMQERGLEDTPSNRRRAKRAVLRSQGYGTGFREELLRDQTSKRSKKLAEMASAASGRDEASRTSTDRSALRMMDALGVSRMGPGYNAEAVAKSMGNEDGMEGAQKLRDSNKRISAMARARREAAARAAAVARAAATTPPPAPAGAAPAPAGAAPAPAGATTPAPAGAAAPTGSLAARATLPAGALRRRLIGAHGTP